jgi:hypothetical protein
LAEGLSFACPTGIVAFGKLAGDLADRDAVVYGVSIDSEFVHLNWRLHPIGIRITAWVEDGFPSTVMPAPVPAICATTVPR